MARQILGLVQEKGYRYRDIAVVASDLSHYEQYVRAYFEDYGIPFFIDKRKPLNQHPVVELICAALQAVTKDWPMPMSSPISRPTWSRWPERTIDLLENYCLAFGVDGRDWADPSRGDSRTRTTSSSTRTRSTGSAARPSGRCWSCGRLCVPTATSRSG